MSDVIVTISKEQLELLKLDRLKFFGEDDLDE